MLLIDAGRLRRLRRQAEAVADGGRICVRVRARATTDPSSATYGDIVIERRSAWWFEAGSSIGQPLQGVRVRKVRPGDGPLDNLRNGRSIATRIDLKPCGSTVEPHPAVAGLLGAALRCARLEGGPRRCIARGPCCGPPG